MCDQLRFNKIYVIQSLSDLEIPTGQNLYKDTIERNIEYFSRTKDVQAEFISVKDKEGFICELGDIADQAEYNIIHPYLHLEMHGLQEGDGLMFASEEWISWQELGPLLTRINIKSRNNLFVSVAACFGSHIFKSVNPFVESPFCGYFGFPDKIKSRQLETDWTSYFEKLFETLDFNLAVEALNISNPSLDYVYETAKGLFDRYSRQIYIHYNNTSKFWQDHPEQARQIKFFSDLLLSSTGGLNLEEAMREACTRMRATKAGIHSKLKNKFMIKTPPQSTDDGTDDIL